jgi:hypothetical protein
MEHSPATPDTIPERIPRADSFSDVDEMRLWVYQTLREVYSQEGVELWLGAANANLGNRMPIAVLHTDPDLVIRLVASFRTQTAS